MRGGVARGTLRGVTRPQTAPRYFSSYRFFGYAPGTAVVRARSQGM